MLIYFSEVISCKNRLCNVQTVPRIPLMAVNLISVAGLHYARVGGTSTIHMHIIL